MRYFFGASTVAIAISVMHASPAYAQSETQEAEALTDASQDGARSKEVLAKDTIVVTGTRIRRTTSDALEPTFVVDDQYLKDRNLTNVADALNEQPNFQGSVTPRGNQAAFGAGQNYVNLFGLGTNRTLTLVNGRRFVSSNVPALFGNPPGTQVDLNVISPQLVDRIDSIAIGGAPTYGTDAIAGTVNIILKEDFEGFQLAGTAGITEDGINPRYNIRGIAGFNTADGRGNIAIAASWDKVERVLQSDLDFYRLGVSLQPNPLGGSSIASLPGRTPATDGRLNPNIPFNTGNEDGIPNSVFIFDTRSSMITYGGVLLTGTGGLVGADGIYIGPGGGQPLQFNPDGTVSPFVQGTPFNTLRGSGGDGVDLYTPNIAYTGLERRSANLNAHYDISESVRIFTEATYFKGIADVPVAQPFFNSALAFAGPASPLVFQTSDPRLNPQARAALEARGATSFRLSTGRIDLGPLGTTSTNELWRVVGGLSGELSILGNPWNWEVYATYGRMKAHYDARAINLQKYANALNVTTNSSGVIVCDPNPTTLVLSGVAPVADANCVPVNVFGMGAPSQAAVDYITEDADSFGGTSQQVYNINLSGALLDNWAGPVSFAAGLEHRVEKGDFDPGEFLLEGRGRSVPVLGAAGSFNTKEAFGEVLLPIVAPENGIPLIRQAEIEAKIRYVDNSLTGGFTAYTLGGRLMPFPGLTLRGNYTRSLRAPSIVELFATESTLFVPLIDPCDVDNIASGPNPTVRQRNCQAFFDAYGITGNFQAIFDRAFIQGTTGGNANLQNETSRSYTFGAIWEPGFVPRLSLAVDWNRIRIEDQITRFGATTSLSGCFDDPNFDTTNPDFGNQFCALTTREIGGPNNGQIIRDPLNPRVSVNYANGAYIEMSGLTAQLNYAMPTEIGRFSLGATYFYLDQYEDSLNAIVASNLEGEIGKPQHSAQVNLGYSTGPFSTNLQVNYASSMEFDDLITIEDQDILGVPESLLVNLSAGWRVEEGAQLRFSVTNLFDKDPPLALGGTAGVYDDLGRRFAISFQIDF